MKFLSMLVLVLGAWIAPQDAAQNPLERVAVVGASASAGWAVVVAKEPGHREADPEDTVLGITHTHVDLADVLDAVIIDLPEPVLGLGNTRFFTSPVNYGRGQIDAAIQVDATCVVGIDFLFWYGYGFFKRDTPDVCAARRARLELGLAQLDRLDVPIYLGTLPDVARAVGAEPFALLQPRQVPQPQCLESMNARIEQWASTRDHVHLIDLATHVQRMYRGDEMVLNGHTWTGDIDLIQFDDLHPTLEGLVAVGEIVAQAMRTHVPTMKTRSDPAAVIAEMAATAAKDASP